LRSGSSSPGVGSLFRVPSSQSRPHAVSAPIRSRVPERSCLRDPPLLSFLLPEHNDSGRPVSPDAAREQPRCGRRSPGLRRCRPQGWFPLDGSGCARNGGPGEESAVFPALRSFAALFHAARVPGVPFRAFPSRGAVPALASLCFLVGSRSTIAGAVSTCASPDFHRLRRPFAKARPEARRDAWARTTDPRQARPIRRSAEAPRPQTALLVETGLAGEPPARPLRSLAPPESPFSR
jgi:hypothetical protein